MNQVVWYQQVWWQGFKEILSMLGFVTGIVALLYTARTYRRNTETRMQDTDANKVKRTYDVMVGYPESTRRLVIEVTQQLNNGFEAATKLEDDGAEAKEVTRWKKLVIKNSDLVMLLHKLDPLGFLLNKSEYLYVNDAMTTFASEVSRILLDKRFEEEINRIVDSSSMEGITNLKVLLEGQVSD